MHSILPAKGHLLAEGHAPAIRRNAITIENTSGMTKRYRQLRIVMPVKQRANAHVRSERLDAFMRSVFHSVRSSGAGLSYGGRSSASSLRTPDRRVRLSGNESL